jgi:hypothetical protein
VITSAVNGQPMTWVTVFLVIPGEQSKEVSVDSQGRFVVEDLPPGKHVLMFQQPNADPRQLPSGEARDVVVREGATITLDVKLSPPLPVVDDGPCCKPYGAPPARRRVV